MYEGVDEARGEDGHEEEEHADLLADALLEEVEVVIIVLLHAIAAFALLSYLYLVEVFGDP